MEGYTKSKFWQFDFKGWTKLVWSLFNIIIYIRYDIWYVCDIYININIYIYDVGYEEQERRDAQTKEEAKHSSNLLEAQADTMMLQGRKKNQMKKERRT